MKINMNYMRKQMTASFNGLGNEILSLMEYIPEPYKHPLMDRYSDLASYIGGLNCVYVDNDNLFTDVSEEVEVMDIWEKMVNILEEKHRHTTKAYGNHR